MRKKIKANDKTIALNRKSRHDYFIERKFEAGILLLGWEVKSLRAGRINLNDAYIIVKNGEAWLLGTNISALPNASKHILTEPKRSRKLLLKRRELSSLETGINQKGFTCICTAFYWKRHLVKCEIALAKGKALYDKRTADKQKDWERDKQRLTRKSVGK